MNLKRRRTFKTAKSKRPLLAHSGRSWAQTLMGRNGSGPEIQTETLPRPGLMKILPGGGTAGASGGNDDVPSRTGRRGEQCQAALMGSGLAVSPRARPRPRPCRDNYSRNGCEHNSPRPPPARRSSCRRAGACPSGPGSRPAARSRRSRDCCSRRGPDRCRRRRRPSRQLMAGGADVRVDGGAALLGECAPGTQERTFRREVLSGGRGDEDGGEWRKSTLHSDRHAYPSLLTWGRREVFDPARSLTDWTGYIVQVYCTARAP